MLWCKFLMVFLIVVLFVSMIMGSELFGCCCGKCWSRLKLLLFGRFRLMSMILGIEWLSVVCVLVSDVVVLIEKLFVVSSVVRFDRLLGLFLIIRVCGMVDVS